LGKKLNISTLEGKMKKLIALVIFCWLVVSLCPSAEAQWEGAKVEQLTHDDLPNRILRLYIDDSDRLHLFYLDGVRDTLTGFVYDYRILSVTKEANGEWSQSQEIETNGYIFGQGRNAGLWMDTRTGIIHLLYSTYAGDLYDDTLYYTNSTIPEGAFTKIDSLPGEQNRSQYYSYEMDFDSLGNAHIVWHLDFDSVGLHWYRVIYTNGSREDWPKQVISPPICVGYGRSGSPFLAVQKDGTAHNIYGSSSTTCYYTRNDSLNSEDWTPDTIPRPGTPLYTYGPSELLTDYSDRIHFFTAGCNNWDCDSTYQFYYHREANGGSWSEAELVQVFPPDSGIIREYFTDNDDVLHLSMIRPMGARVFYTKNAGGSWMEPQLLLVDTCAGEKSTFKFVIDSEGKGHGIYADYKYCGWPLEADSIGVYYFSCYASSVQDPLEDQRNVSFQLRQNYPNPFNHSTIIHYSLGIRRCAEVNLTIYNLLGRKVRNLVDSPQTARLRTAVWDGRDDNGKEVASGIYFYVLTVGKEKGVGKMLLIK
jgi:hypothetical protein